VHYFSFAILIPLPHVIERDFICLFRNGTLNWALLIETALAIFFLYCPGMDKGMRMYPLRYAIQMLDFCMKHQSKAFALIRSSSLLLLLRQVNLTVGHVVLHCVSLTNARDNFSVLL